MYACKFKSRKLFSSPKVQRLMTQRTCRVPVGFRRVVQVSNRDSASVESAGRAAKHSRVAGDIGKDAVGSGSTSSSDDSSGDESSNEKIEEGMGRTEEEWMATHEDEEAGLATKNNVLRGRRCPRRRGNQRATGGNGGRGGEGAGAEAGRCG
jgi:hypothetical protein